MDTNNLDREHVFMEIKQRINSIDEEKIKVISIVGGAGSGKTTFANELVSFLSDACTLSTDDYVLGDREYRRKYLEGGNPLKKYNQRVLNNNIATIKTLKNGEYCYVPTYDDVTGEAVDAKEYHKKISQVKYIIVEGDFDFVIAPDLLIYFDVDDETRLNNRMQRDLAKRKRS